ncbi:MAG: hypothetical protein ABJI45_15170 [Paracoccaceae bacterium]
MHSTCKKASSKRSNLWQRSFSDGFGYLRKREQVRQADAKHLAFMVAELGRIMAKS